MIWGVETKKAVAKGKKVRRELWSEEFNVTIKENNKKFYYWIKNNFRFIDRLDDGDFNATDWVIEK